MTFHRPGQYVDEELLATTTPINTTVAVAALVGTAPRGPVVPTLISSWSDALKQFGKLTGVAAADNLLQSIYNALSAGARDIYVNRAVGAGAAKANLPFALDPSTSTSNNEVQIITITGGPTGGTYTLTFAGQTTADIAYNATASAVQAALVALSDIAPGDVVVTGSGGGPYSTAFQGTYAATNVPPITTDATGLTGGTSPDVTVSTSTQGSDVGASAIDFKAKNPGVWGNRLYVEILEATDPARFNLVIRDVPVGVTVLTNAQIVERWTDLSLNPADPRYVIGVLNSAISPSNYIEAAVHSGYVFATGDVLVASSVAGGSKLTGGVDGSTPTTSEMMDSVYALDVITQPFVLNLPGVFETDVITALVDYTDPSRTRQDNNEQGRGDVFLVIDTSPGEVADDAITQVKTYPVSDYWATYYPPVVIADPSNSVAGSTKLVPVGPLVVGRYMATDASRGVFKSPAGTIDGLLTQVVALDPAADLRNPQLDRLNDAGVNAVKLVPNKGFCIFGARTGKTNFITRYIAPRRTLIQVRAELLDATSFAPFENNDSFLWSLLDDIADKICRELYTAGGLKGATAEQAYYVKSDAENNTAATIEQGEVHLEVGLALQRPAEFVVIQIAQFDGGSTVSDTTNA
jgi:phage tail sheath protein FI